MSFLQSCESTLTQIKTDLLEELIDWCNINTHSFNHSGLNQFHDLLMTKVSQMGFSPQRLDLDPFQVLQDHGQFVTHELGPAMVFTANPEAKLQLLFSIHTDTVFPIDHQFKTCTWLDDQHLRGPGVIDAKGGLLSILTIIDCLKNHPQFDQIGITCLIVPDEEIGSPGSKPLFYDYAQDKTLGLVFEPCLPDGTMISERKGSAVFTFQAQGKSAHVGRNLADGVNAITALSRLILDIEAIKPSLHSACNIGLIHGGIAVNQVPEHAYFELNIRGTDPDLMKTDKQRLLALCDQLNKNETAKLTYHEQGFRPPKPFNAQTESYFNQYKDIAASRGIMTHWKPSGGVCDGNWITDAGVPCIDTLGPQGDGLHTDQETLLVDSFIERILLCLGFIDHLVSNP